MAAPTPDADSQRGMMMTTALTKRAGTRSGKSSRTTAPRRRAVTPQDLHRFRFVGDPRISPDGRTVVFMQKTIGEKNEYVTNLWRVPAAGGDAVQFTAGNRDRMPRFSPDGATIAFIGAREKERPQVYTIPVDGGEARALTEFPEGAIGALRWSPTGRHIAVSFRAQPAEWTTTAVKERKEHGLSDPPWVIDDWWYRLDGEGYFGRSRYCIHLVDVADGSHRVLYDRDTTGFATFDFSPDGAQLAITTNRDRKALVRPWKSEILRVDVATGAVTPVPGLPEGPKTCVRWSPDGRHLAFASREFREDSEYSTENLELWLCDPVTGDARSLTGREDYCLLAATLSDTSEAAFSPTIEWAPDGKRVFMQIGWHGETHVASVGVRGGPIAIHTQGARSYRPGNLSSDGRTIVMTAGGPTALAEVAVATVAKDAFEARAITSLNDEVLRELELAVPKSHWIRSVDGTRVQVWTLEPPNGRGSRRRPAILEVHGGPHAQYGVDFFHELQVLAAAGYVVVYSNPRGSKGYGRDHCAAIRGRWGDKDWIDIEAVTAFMRDLPGVDPERMGIMGGSYGGYMTVWAIGHTNAFKAAITDRCVSNLHSMWGSSDFPSAPDQYFPGNSWDRPEALWDQSPLKYLGNARSPTLIIHSEGDLRCNVEQAEQVFMALKARNVATRLVRYPRSTSHGMSRGGPPDMRIHRLEQILAWWRKHLS